MRSRSVVIASLTGAITLLILGAVPPGGPAPLPARMADTGGGSQLVTAQAARTGSTTGTVTWWDRRDGRWIPAGSAAARFGAKGLADGGSRKQGTYTTPTGLYGLPFAFGTEPAPVGTTTAYRRVHQDSWWCQDNDSRSYNRWTEPRPADCRATESEHLVSYAAQYAHAFVIAYNYDRPVRGRGAGIFLHVNGSGATAGCVSVPADAMRRILRWAEPARRPHIAIGTASGTTAITRY
ncbi:MULTISPECIES: L,D-transpeptidase [unclassified Streptomyces]|uniref:L,D-transpeptidase family protein n=1 Tax=unclassified Streptomyces TaxID=2593676 RepID=UPI0036E40529